MYSDGAEALTHCVEIIFEGLRSVNFLCLFFTKCFLNFVSKPSFQNSENKEACQNVINSSPLIALVEITVFRLESKSCKGFFLNKFSTNKSTQIITGHVIHNLPYTYKLQL